MDFVVYDVPPSNNKYMGGGGRGRNFQYQKDKKRWAKLIKRAVGDNKPDTPIEKSVVTLTYYFKTRHRRDPDNYSGKFLLDGLVEAGVIEDDSFNHIDLVIVGKYDKDNPRTILSVKEL